MSTLTANTDIIIREPQNGQELADLVQNTMAQIQERFGQMSDTILKRIDDMGKQIDNLERNIAYIISQSNAETP